VRLRIQAWYVRLAAEAQLLILEARRRLAEAYRAAEEAEAELVSCQW
jgi:hypothetical protein